MSLLLKSLLAFTIISCSSMSNKEAQVNFLKTKEFNTTQAQKNLSHNIVNDLPYWETSPKELEQALENALNEADNSLDKLVKRKKSERDFANTIIELDTIFYKVSLVGNRIGLIASTSLNKDMRDKANKLDTKLSSWFVDTDAREDIYKVVQEYADTRPKLKGEDAKLLKETLQDFKRVGFHLPKKTQNKIKSLKKELSELQTKIDENIKAAGSKKIVFTKDELEGLGSDELSALEKDGDKYIASTGVTYQVYTILEYAKKEATRKKAMTARNQRAMDTNAKLTQQVVKIRAQIADLLGYKSWADYKTEVKLAKSGKAALQFVDNLIKGLEPKYKKELKELRALKVAETKNKNAKIESWDVRYYQRIYDKKKFNLDMASLKKYFSYETTLNGMFKVFERIFKIKVQFVEAPYVWDKKVTLVRIDDAITNKELGFLYLDMFPRPEHDKYGHFAMFTIRSGKLLSNGKYRRPVAALVCNFPLPTKDQPSLLDFDQVETLFHEFGHALHGILTQAKYARFAGTRVERDFVEAPSQMLENWVNNKAVLDTFAVNYKDKKDKFPNDALKKIKKSKLATIATFYRRQLAFAKMDLAMHQNIKPNQDIDTAKYTNKYLRDIYLPFPENTAMVHSFGHLWGGYDAGYYGYAWADNLSADMASKFENAKDQYLDKKMGMRLRREVYERGASRDSQTSIERFLRRKPNNKAFLKKLGIN